MCVFLRRLARLPPGTRPRAQPQTTSRIRNTNTNRYDSVGGNSLTYNQAGDLTTDKGGYTHQYDYENRLTKIIKLNSESPGFPLSRE